MSKIGILIANGSHAKFAHFHSAEHPEPLEILEEFTHDESRLKRLDIVSDRPGHYKSSHKIRGAYGEDRDPKEITKEHFAIELAKKLDTYRTHEGFNKFLIVSPSHFLGLIQKHLSKETSTLIYDTIQKDYTGCTEKDLFPYVRDHLLPRV